MRKVVIATTCVLLMVIATLPTASAEVHFAAGDARFANNGVEHLYVTPDNNTGWPDWEFNQQSQQWEMKWTPPAHTPDPIPIEPRFVLHNDLEITDDPINFELEFTLEVQDVSVNPPQFIGGDATWIGDTAVPLQDPLEWSEAIGPVNCVGWTGQQNPPIYVIMVTLTITHTDPDPDDIYSDYFEGYIYVS